MTRSAVDSLEASDPGLLIVDTACARSVAGRAWYDLMAQWLREAHDYQIERVDDNEAFRFGPGAPVHSSFAILLPVEWQGRGAVIRISIVPREVPPLISKAVLKYLRANIDLDKDVLRISALGGGAID